MYILTNTAENDLEQIREYIAQDSFIAADRFLDKIFTAFEMLSATQNIGTKRDYITKKDVRFWNVGNYVIVYKSIKENTAILRILSSYRNLVDLI